MKPEEIQIDPELIDKMGGLSAIVGLASARELAIQIFTENGWTIDEAASIVDRAIKALVEQ